MDFGDGTTSKEKNPLHVYPSPGSYTVSLKVSNGVGSDTKEMMIQIETEDNWYLSNSIMLDENGSNAYNYTSLDELFTDLFRFKFYPDTHTEISMSGSSFELSSAFDLTARKNEFLKK